MEGIIKIHGKDYQTVSYRISKFRSEFTIAKGWGIETEILVNTDKKILVKATITSPENKVVATGHAEEKREGRINLTAAIENGETSAIGRCLAAAGFVSEEYCSANELLNKTENNKKVDPDIEKIMYIAKLLQMDTATLDKYKKHYREPKPTLKALESIVARKDEKKPEQSKAELKKVSAVKPDPKKHLDAFPGTIDINLDGFENIQLAPPCLTEFKLAYKQKLIEPTTIINGKWLATTKEQCYVYVSKTGKECKSVPRQLLHIWENYGDNTADYAKALLKLFPSKSK